MLVRKDQITPFHYHGRKVKDIINRGEKGTGRLAVELHDYGKMENSHRAPSASAGMEFGAS